MRNSLQVQREWIAEINHKASAGCNTMWPLGKWRSGSECEVQGIGTGLESSMHQPLSQASYFSSLSLG